MMYRWVISAFFYVMANVSTAYKVAIFVPDIAGSQILFNVRIAETLAASGHEVTLIRLDIIAAKKVEPKISASVKQWRVKAHPDDHNYEELRRHQSLTAFREVSFLSSGVRNALQNFFSSFKVACEVLAQDKQFLERLREAKFDIAFTHYYDYCPIGLIHYAKIPTWIWLNGGQLMDVAARLIGVPTPSSYVPLLMMDASDKMSFMQRFKNFIGQSLMPAMFIRMLIDPQTETFRRHVDPEMPHLSELAAQCPLVMVNSDELYSLARPTLHKIIYIGGLGMSSRSTKPLQEEFKTIVDRSKHVIVMSFGSVANASLMPDSWKNSLLGAFKQFPEIEFIMRYSSHDLDNKLPPNVHISNWIPQVDLLQNKKTLAFISHGGFNSIQETIHSGKPIITIPLFGDQYGNARLAERRGIGIVIPKAEFTEKNLVDAISEILNNSMYTVNAQQLLAMIRAKPVQPEQQLVKWTEFVAKFKTLPNLVPYGVNLGLIQYYCIDVVALLAFIVFCFLFVVTCTVRAVYRKLHLRIHRITTKEKCS